MEIDIFHYKGGHDIRKYDPKDKDDIRDIAEVVQDKLREGWILYGGKKKETLKKLADSRKTRSEIEDILKQEERLMVESPASTEEPARYERLVVSPPVQGG